MENKEVKQKQFLNYPSIVLSVSLVLLLIFLLPANLKSQSTENIGNVAYRLEGDKLLITYDIVKADSKQSYDISIEIIQPSGERIIPVTVYGDINKGVVPGRRRSVIWNFVADDVVLEDGFKIRIYGKPAEHIQAMPDSVAKKFEIARTLDVGLGFGLDYGGLFGGRVTYTPIPYIGIFGCAGIMLDGTGWEAGAKGYFIRKTSMKVFRPYIKAMYDVNSEIYIKGDDRYNKLYPGFSAGPGMEFRFGRFKSHGINLDLNFPVRSTEYYDDLNDIKNNPFVTIESEPGPVTISFGYHVEF
jgi:hypothetical protein